jgi:hypothetical protein
MSRKQGEQFCFLNTTQEHLLCFSVQDPLVFFFFGQNSVVIFRPMATKWPCSIGDPGPPEKLGFGRVHKQAPWRVHNYQKILLSQLKTQTLRQNNMILNLNFVN